jgi:hypothetical protein
LGSQTTAQHKRRDSPPGCGHLRNRFYTAWTLKRNSHPLGERSSAVEEPLTRFWVAQVEPSKQPHPETPPFASPPSCSGGVWFFGGQLLRFQSRRPCRQQLSFQVSVRRERGLPSHPNPAEPQPQARRGSRLACSSAMCRSCRSSKAKEAGRLRPMQVLIRRDKVRQHLQIREPPRVGSRRSVASAEN